MAADEPPLCVAVRGQCMLDVNAALFANQTEIAQCVNSAVTSTLAGNGTQHQCAASAPRASPALSCSEVPECHISDVPALCPLPGLILC